MLARMLAFLPTGQAGRGVGVAVVRQRGLVLLWIALREHESEPPSQSFDRVDDRSGLVFVVAAERYAIEERFGLGAFLSITGRSVHGAGLVVPDDLAETRAEVLRAWCASHFGLRKRRVGAIYRLSVGGRTPSAR